jgi:hypothetical protein
MILYFNVQTREREEEEEEEKEEETGKKEEQEEERETIRGLLSEFTASTKSLLS